MALGAFVSHIRNVIAFNQLPENQRRITFYSEGPNYWSYIGGLMMEVLESSDLHVCYVCSSKDDPGLLIKHPRLHSFLIDEGSIRNWFFANIDTGVMVMTMPDIHQYQVKRSKNDVHYLYVQHSLVSFHMVYRTGAFDHYDTIFCAGPHHLEEMKAIQEARKLSKKSLFEHGYARLDSIKHEAETRNQQYNVNAKPHYLLAPSWGENGTIETGLGAKIVELLLNEGSKVTLRPHPQTTKFFRERVDHIIKKHEKNSNFEYETGVQGQESLHKSDVMICDWSGAALDYAFGLGKPVIFIDVSRKINNLDYEEIAITPFEVSIREKIGIVISPDNLDAILSFIPYKLDANIADQHVFNVGCSDKVGAKEIIRLTQNLKQ